MMVARLMFVHGDLSLFHDCCLRSGLHMGFRISPVSKLLVLLLSWMSMASCTFLFIRWLSFALTLAASQSTLCPLCCACTAIPFLLSFLFTAYWCSFNLILGVVSSLSNVDVCAVCTWHLRNHTFLQVFRSLCLHLHQLVAVSGCCETWSLLCLSFVQFRLKKVHGPKRINFLWILCTTLKFNNHLTYLEYVVMNLYNIIMSYI